MKKWFESLKKHPVTTWTVSIALFVAIYGFIAPALISADDTPLMLLGIAVAAAPIIYVAAKTYNENKARDLEEGEEE